MHLACHGAATFRHRDTSGLSRGVFFETVSLVTERRARDDQFEWINARLAINRSAVNSITTKTSGMIKVPNCRGPTRLGRLKEQGDHNRASEPATKRMKVRRVVGRVDTMRRLLGNALEILTRGVSRCSLITSLSSSF
jgi:hypothetical protein